MYRFKYERLLAMTYSKIRDFKSFDFESASNLNCFSEKFVVSVSALKQLPLQNLADF